MDAQLLMKTATLAGEMLLSSGAETYRVEDTMNYILKTAQKHESSDVLVIMTGISATLKVEDEAAITVMRRVEKISTNLNVITEVNEISRRLCGKKITVEEAYEQLQQLGASEYTKREYDIGYIAICVGFVLFFGGGLVETLASIVVGIFFNAFSAAGKDLEFHDFLQNVMCSIGIAFVSMMLKSMLKSNMDMDIVIISCIMPTVPGVAITNAVRDLLRGDYLSGAARILEAFLRAAGIALGIGLGIGLFGKIF